MAWARTLTYYVLLPLLLIQTLVKADLTRCRLAASAVRCSCRRWQFHCCVLGCAPARTLSVDGPAFTSIFQGRPAGRPTSRFGLGQPVRQSRTGVRLSRDGCDLPLSLLCVVVLAHYASPEKQLRRHCYDRGGRSPDLGARSGSRQRDPPAAAQMWHEVADALGRSSLAIGLLVTGAGLHLKGLFRRKLGAASGSSSSWC